MEKALVLLLGVAAWVGVAALALFVVEYWGDDNQVLAFIPILVAVVIAWAIGEAVTQRVFTPQEEGE
ncbi:MAG TPA: hypothetical protein VNM91_10880 [Dehalococcoidia bacterium]|nr:hypothetical protein [Dehalococcoidia bacterium]